MAIRWRLDRIGAMQSLQTFVLPADYITIMTRATSAAPPRPADENGNGQGDCLPTQPWLRDVCTYLRPIS